MSDDLKARLRSDSYAKPSFPIDARDAMLKAADAIDARDAEIARLKWENDQMARVVRRTTKIYVGAYLRQGVVEAKNIEAKDAEIARLREALEDAIRSPKGVVPDSVALIRQAEERGKYER